MLLESDCRRARRNGSCGAFLITSPKKIVEYAGTLAQVLQLPFHVRGYSFQRLTVSEEGRIGNMRTSFAGICAVAMMLCALVSPPAQAEVRILASRGGQVGPFLDLFEKVRASGERVVIDGPCLSACTLVLSIVPRERICVTRRAMLGFHAARSKDRRGRMYAEPEASALVLQTYPSGVRSWITQRGGLTSHLLLLRGRELAAFYPTCR
jgi:hypothetical protein